MTPAPHSLADSARPALTAGMIVGERYRIEALLGEGGMGAVYAAEHVHMKKRVAVKVLLPAWSQVPEVLARFEREAVAAAKVEHEHIARALDFGRLDDGAFFLVLEYVAGQTLRQRLDAGRLSPLRVLHIARGMTAALAAAHAQGIVHRDLKPENVMLVERDGDIDFVKILDFGIAKVETAGGGSERPAPRTGLTKMGAVIGTPEYMSPEQALGQPVDARTDLYALGVILYEMLVGERPFQGGAVTVLRQQVLSDAPSLPSDVVAQAGKTILEVVTRLLQKTPEARFASATEVMAALDVCGAELRDGASAMRGQPSPPLAAAVTELAPPLERVRRLASPRTQMAIATAATLAIVALFMVRSVGHPDTAPSPSAAQTASANTAAPSPASALPPPPPIAQEAAEPTAEEKPADDTATRPAKKPANGPKTSQKPKEKRRTGPFGIYIPPPSEWGK